MMDFHNEAWTIRLKDCVQLSDRLGISAKDLRDWATISSDFQILER